MFEIGKMLNWDKETTHQVARYLKGEGIIKFRTVGGGISITHYGVVQIEKALMRPEEATTYFPPAIIIKGDYVGGDKVGGDKVEGDKTRLT